MTHVEVAHWLNRSKTPANKVAPRHLPFLAWLFWAASRQPSDQACTDVGYFQDGWHDVVVPTIFVIPSDNQLTTHRYGEDRSSTPTTWISSTVTMAQFSTVSLPMEDQTRQGLAFADGIALLQQPSPKAKYVPSAPAPSLDKADDVAGCLDGLLQVWRVKPCGVGSKTSRARRSCRFEARNHPSGQFTSRINRDPYSGRHPNHPAGIR